LNIRALLRPAVFVPESKGLNDLLRQFRDNRNHLAIVIDEYGRTAGLITIEDVLEQIVGEIEDEFDIAEDAGDIFGLPDRSFRVSGDTAIERVDEAFGVDLRQARQAEDEHDFDTLGGLIAHEMGHVAKASSWRACALWSCTPALARCAGSRCRPCLLEAPTNPAARTTRLHPGPLHE
jgi:magnesium and cobalt transporter